MLFSNNSFVRKKINIKQNFGTKFPVWKFNLHIFHSEWKRIETIQMWISSVRKEEKQSIQKQWNGKIPNPKHFFPFNGLLIRRSMKQKNFLILELCTPHTVFFIPHSKMVLWTETPYKRPQQKQQFRTLSCTMLCHFVSMLLSVVGCGRSLYFSINGFSEIFTRLKIVSISTNE